MSLEELCDLLDKSYMRQVVMDNHLNTRTWDLVRTVKDVREKINAILAKEKTKDLEYIQLELKCKEVMGDIETNPFV